jgi:hypothetical protein
MKIKKFRRWKRIDRWLQTAIIAMSIIIVGGLVSGQTITTLTLGILRLGNNATITSGQVFLPDGSNTAPSFSFTSETNTGIYKQLPGKISYTTLGNPTFVVDSSFLAWIPSDSGSFGLGASADLRILRDDANTLALKNGNADQTQRWYGANGSYFQIKTSSELLTIQNAASTDTTMDIPLNATVQGVAVYVVTVIPTAATFTVTGATSGTTFNTAAIGTAAGSNDVGNQNCPYKNGAAQKIKITPNLVPAAATGQVRIVLMYTIPSPPTS